MNVLFVSHCCSHGGANLALKEITDEYRKRNFEVTVLFPDHSEWESRYAETGVKTLVLKYHRWVTDAKHGKVRRFFESRIKHFVNVRAAKKAAKYVTENNIDIIHTNDSLTEVGALVSEICKIPHVWHIRECLKEQFGFDFVYNRKYVKSKFSAAEKVIVISDYVKSCYPEYFGNNTVKVYDAVSCNMPHKDLSAEKKDFRILFAGGTAKAKNCEDIISALDILLKKGYRDILLDFAGTVDTSLLPEKTERIKQNINFLGMVADLSAEREKCTVSVGCSIEAFGRVPAEALCCSMATIGPNKGAYAEVVNTYDNAFTYTLGNPESLANEIEKIYKNRDIVLKIAESNRERAQMQYSPQRLVDELSNIYKILKK